MADTTGAGGPWIRIIRRGGQVTIEQRRPAVLAHLQGQPAERALAMVPGLLPVCGNAQAIAAGRALEAGRERPPENEPDRERQLWREQAQSAAWRLAVDWPDLLHTARDLPWLKRLRGAEDGDAAALLAQALEGLEQVESTADLAAWARRRPGTAAAMVRRVLPGGRVSP